MPMTIESCETCMWCDVYSEEGVHRYRYCDEKEEYVNLDYCCPKWEKQK